MFYKSDNQREGKKQSDWKSSGNQIQRNQYQRKSQNENQNQRFYKSDNQRDGKKQVHSTAARLTIYRDDRYIATNNMQCNIKST